MYSYELNGSGRDRTLSLYNPDTYAIYVYPAVVGSSHIECDYAYIVGRPGEAIDRKNCAIGSTVSH